MFTIQVIDHRDGKPVEYKKVGVIFEGFFRGSTRDIRTDSRGEAHFDYDNGQGKVYINGECRWEGYLEGRVIVYI